MCRPLPGSPAFDHFMMGLAIEQARLAAHLGEVPVGAVICRGDEVLAATCNRREIDKNALAHAELLAVDHACKKLGGWRLHQCDLYVTLEPCPMCAGAIVNARLRRVVFGAGDPKAGCFGSIIHFNEVPFNHHPDIIGGVREKECASLLSDFFLEIRAKKNR